MRKVSIIGCSGAGKSTLAAKLGPLLDLPVIHLDAVYWRPNWQKPPADEWRQQLRALLGRDRWILDGNYGSTMRDRIAASDTVILLDLPRLVCLFRVVKRALKGWGRSRTDLNPACLEQLPDRAFLSWIWHYPQNSLPGVLQLLQEVEQKKRIVILRSAADTREFLQGLERGQARTT